MQKRIYLSIVLLFLGSVVGMGQIFQKYGLSFKLNSAAQDIEERNFSTDIRFRSSSTFTYGIGVYAESRLLPYLNFRPQISFIQKQSNQQTRFFDPISSILPEVNTSLNYLSVDLILKGHLNKVKYNPFFMVGLRQDMLIERTSQNAINEPRTVFVDVNGILTPIVLNSFGTQSQLAAHENFTLGFLIAAGLEIKNLISFGIEVNKDITIASEQIDNTVAKNYLVSLNIDFNIAQLIFNQRTK